MWPQPLYGKPTDEPTLPNEKDFRHALANRYKDKECENYISTTLTLLKVHKEHSLPALINPYLEERTREYNRIQGEALQSEIEKEGEETTEEQSDKEGESSQGTQEDSSR